MNKAVLSVGVLLLVLSCVSNSNLHNQITLNIKGSIDIVKANKPIDVSDLVELIGKYEGYQNRSFRFRVVTPDAESERIIVDVKYSNGSYQFDNFVLKNGSIVYIPH